MASGPHAQYARRLEEARSEVARGRRQARLTSNLRLVVFLAGAALAWPALRSDALSAAWLALPALLFVALVMRHDRQLRGLARAERRVAFFELGLARLEDRWPGSGVAGEEFRDPEHPYADDLDCFGRGSLFERLCNARTRAGQATLAAWLRAPAEPEEIARRQEAVRELAPELTLREELASLGEEVRAGLHPEALRAWGEAPPVLAGSAWTSPTALAAAGLPLLTLAALAAWWGAGAGPLPFALALVVQGGFAWALRARVREVTGAVELPGRDLTLLAEILACLERTRFAAPRLVALRARLDTHGEAPSRRIAALRLRIDLLDARRNQLFAPFAALVLWTTQLALALERWRAECGPALAPWIDAVGELEALASLAVLAYEHPDHAYPEVEASAPGFEAEALGHPLLPAATCVRNDLALGGERRALVVSGSNMSGKSTLLRAVGLNAVLAGAGAPVRARRLRLAPLAVGASIRVQDSLLEGRSRFYAEIRRLRAIMDLCDGSLPVLFLIDEVLQGTNSHDRGIGAEGLVRGLLERGAVGLVTTHDLALAEMAERLAPRVANVHFEDHIEDGEIAFDYRMRPGPVRKSNALALMRAVGLEV